VIERATVRGASTDEIVRGVARSHLVEIERCYVEYGLSRRPELAGEVDVYYVIGDRGAVLMSSIAHSTLRRPKVDLCIADAFRGWRFPRPEGGGIAIITQPILLAP
jgi:hypothetical protein